MMSQQALLWLEEHGDMLYAYALRRLSDAHQAEEAVQNTLLAALENASGYAGRASVSTWLVGILKYKIIDQIREQQRWHAPISQDEIEQSVGEDDLFSADGHWAHEPVEWSDPAQLLDRKQLQQRLERCLARLPRRMAQLIWLRQLQDEPAELVCQSLGISQANLYQLLLRARQTLRVCLSEGGQHAHLS